MFEMGRNCLLESPILLLPIRLPECGVDEIPHFKMVEVRLASSSYLVCKSGLCPKRLWGENSIHWFITSAIKVQPEISEIFLFAVRNRICCYHVTASQRLWGHKDCPEETDDKYHLFHSRQINAP